jgi:hypothetical protein
MAEEAIKLPGSSYDEVKKISVLYTNVGKQAPLGEIARSAGMDRTIVSRNNGFLTSIGVISKGQQKEITTLGAELGRALEYRSSTSTMSLLLAPSSPQLSQEKTRRMKYDRCS